MELAHVGAIVLRHTRLWLRDKNIFMVTLYWPMFEIVMWGFLGLWMQRSMGTFGTVLLLNIVLWQLVCRSGMSVFWSFIEEVMSNNLSSLFSTPLRLSEWSLGAVIFSTMQVSVVIACVSALVIFCYGLSASMVLKALLLFGPALLISGFGIAFLILPILCLSGKRGQEIAFIINWAFTPFSGVFYPIDVLPPLGQKISQFLPMSHVYKSVLLWVSHDGAYLPHLIRGYVLALLYLPVTIVFFFFIFNRAKNKGLARLSD